MKMMPYGVAAALLLGGSLMVPPAKAWQSGAESQSSSVQPADNRAADNHGNSGFSVRDVQQELKQAGLYNGTIDGVWGPESRNAMQQYQKQHGLYASGQLDHDTLQAMRGDNGAIQSGSSGNDSDRDIGTGMSRMPGDLGSSGQGSGYNSTLGGSDEEQR